MLQHAPLDHAAEFASVPPGVEVFARRGLVKLGLDAAIRAQEARKVELPGFDVAKRHVVAVEREAEPDLPEPAAEVEHPDRAPAGEWGEALDHLVVEPVHVRALGIEAVEQGILVHHRVLPVGEAHGLEEALLFDVIAEEPAPTRVRLVCPVSQPKYSMSSERRES